MVEHIVLFRLKPETTEAQKQDLMRGLLALKDQIEGIVDASVGENFCERARGYHLGFVVRFTDRASLEAYGPHPAHRKVVEELVDPIREEILALDYEHWTPSERR